ncbi:MAG: motility associated factor glycosyltransferase family protein [Epsilonproteobacteria bacterium]|nr:motility associated factor glycosyltransferase family protein [Campylobacterota bacterium]
MHNPQTHIAQNYRNNITYFQKEHPDLYRLIEQFEMMVDQGKLVENFILTYEDGGFDIFNTQSNKYLYNQQSKHYVNVMQQSVNHRKNENVFETFKLLGKNDTTKDYNFVDDLFVQSKDKEMQQIFKFIFFGSGLHLDPIANKIDAKYYLIIEDNIELFRLSLLTTPYFEIAKKAKLFFAVGSDNESFGKIAQQFFNEAFYYNHYIKFFESIFHSEEKLNWLHTIIVSQSHLNFFYSSILEQYTRPLYYLQNNYPFVNLTSKELQQFAQDKKVILVAPGPSLDKHITFLQDKQDEYFIVALSATLSILENAQIKPDIVTHFDGFARSAIHFQKLQDKTFLQDSLLLLSAKTPLTIVSMFAKEQIFFFESGTNFKQGFGELSAFCAGSATYLILVALGFKEILLVGLDLALNQQTLQTHAHGYSYTLTANENAQTKSFRDSIIEVAGNLQPKVKSTPNFATSIKAIDEISLGLKQDYQQIYNLNDGAKLKNTTPADATLFHTTSHSKKSHHDLKTVMHNNSAATLSTEETQFIQEIQQKTQQKILLVKSFATQTFHNKTEFLQALIQFKNDLCLCQEKSCEVLLILLENYTRFVYGYIFDTCNSQGLQPDIRTIQKDLVNNLLEILQRFAHLLDYNQNGANNAKYRNSSDRKLP